LGTILVPGRNAVRTGLNPGQAAAAGLMLMRNTLKGGPPVDVVLWNSALDRTQVLLSIPSKLKEEGIRRGSARVAPK
jgi:hypothetical protein